MTSVFAGDSWIPAFAGMTVGGGYGGLGAGGGIHHREHRGHGEVLSWGRLARGDVSCANRFCVVGLFAGGVAVGVA